MLPNMVNVSKDFNMQIWKKIKTYFFVFKQNNYKLQGLRKKHKITKIFSRKYLCENVPRMVQLLCLKCKNKSVSFDMYTFKFYGSDK